MGTGRERDSEETLHFTDAEREFARTVTTIMAPVIPSLAAALRPRTEIVLHDLTRMPHTIVAIGGTITGRSVGGPLSDLGVRVVRAGVTDDLIAYRTEHDGMTLRSSSIFFRADSGRAVASICINSDIETLRQAHDLIGAMVGFGTTPDAPAPPTETFTRTVDELTEEILDQAIAAIAVPVDAMKKKHKIEVVRDLHSRGFFTLREAADTIARRLHVSRFTIYNYLNEIDEPDQ